MRLSSESCLRPKVQHYTLLCNTPCSIMWCPLGAIILFCPHLIQCDRFSRPCVVTFSLCVCVCFSPDSFNSDYRIHAHKRRGGHRITGLHFGRKESPGQEVRNHFSLIHPPPPTPVHLFSIRPTRLPLSVVASHIFDHHNTPVLLEK